MSCCGSSAIGIYLAEKGVALPPGGGSGGSGGGTGNGAPPVNNLDSTDVNAPLAANQGRVLDAALIKSGKVVGNDLILTPKNGPDIKIDVTPLATDKDTILKSAVLAGKILTLTNSDGTKYDVDLSSVAGSPDIKVTNAALAGKVLTVTNSDGSKFDVDLSAIDKDTILKSGSVTGGVLSLVNSDGTKVDVPLPAAADKDTLVKSGLITDTNPDILTLTHTDGTPVDINISQLMSNREFDLLVLQEPADRVKRKIITEQQAKRYKTVKLTLVNGFTASLANLYVGYDWAVVGIQNLAHPAGVTTKVEKFADIPLGIQLATNVLNTYAQFNLPNYHVGQASVAELYCDMPCSATQTFKDVTGLFQRIDDIAWESIP